MNSTESSIYVDKLSQEKEEQWQNDDDAGSEKYQNGFVNKFLEFSKASSNKYVDSISEKIEESQMLIEEETKSTNAQSNVWYCELCPTFYMQGFRLKVHYQEAHPTNKVVIGNLAALLIEESHKKPPQCKKPTKLTCEICQKVYYQKGEMINHYNEMHPIIEDIENESVADMPNGPIYTFMKNMEETFIDDEDSLTETTIKGSNETINENKAYLSQNNELATPVLDFRKVPPNEDTKYDISTIALLDIEKSTPAPANEFVKRASKRLPKPKKFDNFIRELKKPNAHINAGSSNVKIIKKKLTFQNPHRTRNVLRVELEKLDNSALNQKPIKEIKNLKKASPDKKKVRAANSSEHSISNYKIIKPFKRNIPAKSSNVSHQQKENERYHKNYLPETRSRLKRSQNGKLNQPIEKRRMSCRKSKPIMLDEYVYTLKENTQTDANVVTKIVSPLESSNNSDKMELKKKQKKLFSTINKNIKTESIRKRKPKLFPDFVYSGNLNRNNSPCTTQQVKEEVKNMTKTNSKSKLLRDRLPIEAKKIRKVAKNSTKKYLPVANFVKVLSEDFSSPPEMDRKFHEPQKSNNIPLSVNEEEILPMLTPKLEIMPKEDVFYKHPINYSQHNFKYADLSHLPVFSTMDSLNIFDKPQNNDVSLPLKKKRGRPRKPINVEEILLKMKLKTTRQRYTIKENKASHTFPKTKKSVCRKSFKVLDNSVGKKNVSSQKGGHTESTPQSNKMLNNKNFRNSSVIKQNIPGKGLGNGCKSTFGNLGTPNDKHDNSQCIKPEFARKSSPHSFQYFYDNNIVNPMSIVVQKLDEGIYRREVNKF